MKQLFTAYDGLFLLFLYFKLSNTGPHLSWFVVFSPYVLAALLTFLLAMAKLFSWKDRINFYFWKIALKIRIRGAGKRARQAMKQATQEGPKEGNPGRFYDAEKMGKS